MYDSGSDAGKRRGRGGGTGFCLGGCAGSRARGLASPRKLSGKLKAFLAAAGGKPVVLDGDALNLLAKEPELRSYKTGSWILTPHPGELGRLLGKGTEEVLADLPEAARQLAAAYGCIAV